MNGDILNIARVEYHTGQPQFTSPWAEQLEASKSADLVESSVELAANSSDKCERTSAFQSCIDIKELLKGPERLWVVFYASCVASIGSIVLGYAVGNTSPLTLQLQNEDYQRNVSRAAFTKLHSDIFGGLLPTGAAVGGLTFGIAADVAGRKVGMIIMAAILLGGWALVALSRLLQGSALVGVIYTGQAIIGYGIGSASLIVPMYISEVSPPKLRGLLGSLPQLCINIGILLVFSFGAVPTDNPLYRDLSYEYLASIAFGILLIYELLLLTLKESPFWLIHKHHAKKALKSLKWLRGPKIDTAAELQLINEKLEKDADLSYFDTFKLFPKRTVWKPLILVLCMMVFQQLSGIIVVIFYAATIFDAAGIVNPNQTAAVSIGIIQVIATVICVLLTDLVGRKVLLMISSMGLCLCLSALGAYFYVYFSYGCSEGAAEVVLNGTAAMSNSTDSVALACGSSFRWMAIISIALFTGIYNIGMGAVPWLLSAEMFPIAVRGKCMSIATFLLWVMATLVSSTFSSYQELVGSYGVFWTFAVSCLLCFIFVMIFLPETKGKTLLEIEMHFAGSHIEDIFLREESNSSSKEETTKL